MAASNETKAHIGLKVSIAIAVPLLALAIVSFIGIQRLDSISNQLITALLSQVNKSNSLILNADRDFYQSVQAYLFMRNSTDKKQLKDQAAAFTENAQQTLDRVTSAVKALEGSPAMSLKHKTANKTIPVLFDEFKVSFDAWSKTFDPSTNTIKDEKKFWATFDSARDSINLIT